MDKTIKITLLVLKSDIRNSILDEGMSVFVVFTLGDEKQQSSNKKGRCVWNESFFFRHPEGSKNLSVDLHINDSVVDKFSLDLLTSMNIVVELKSKYGDLLVLVQNYPAAFGLGSGGEGVSREFGGKKSVSDPLDYFFNPKSVALIGASEKIGVGRTMLFNLLKSPFGGVIYPVNPKNTSTLGVETYKTIALCPGDVELAIIAVNAKFVPGSVKECAAKGVKACIIVSAGFAEMGPPGRALEAQIKECAQASGMRIVGPNCLGVSYSVSGLNATFAASMINPGRVAFLSQSGALCTAMLDFSRLSGFGFSAFVSVGSMLDVDWPALITYFGQDSHTSAIVIYMETVGNAGRFIAAAQAVTPRKPIVVIKAGRSAAGAKAASSHTGALAGADEVADAAFERAGVIRVLEITDLFALAELLSYQPRPSGPRLAIVTNAGGPGVLTTDALTTGGGQLTPVEGPLLAELNSFLPDAWSHGNPIDVLGDAPPKRYTQTVEAIAKNPNVDGVLVILTPQDMTDPTASATALVPLANINKIFITSWMGGLDVAAGVNILRKAHIPNFSYPDQAVRVFNYLHKYAANVAHISKPTPAIPLGLGFDVSKARMTVRGLYRRALHSGRTILSEYEAKKVLEAYNIPGGKTELALSAEEAVTHSRAIGYPVVLKVHSETITHKSDVGGVKLNIKTDDEVRAAYEEIKANVTQHASEADFLGVVVLPLVKLRDSYEVILGAYVDAQFGPVILFGLGGVLVEVFKDKGLGLAPLNETFAELLVEKTKIYQALKGVRGRAAVDLALLKRIIVSFSYLLADHPWIKEFDINPLVASPDGILALDARIIVYDGTVTKEEDLPRSAVPLK